MKRRNSTVPFLSSFDFSPHHRSFGETVVALDLGINSRLISGTEETRTREFTCVISMNASFIPHHSMLSVFFFYSYVKCFKESFEIF